MYDDMRDELNETLLLIESKLQETGQQRVFIDMAEFPWFTERNGQLTRYYEAGYVTKPMFFDNSVEISLTSKGKEFVKSNMNASKPSVFISYNWGSEEIAEELEQKLKPYAEVKRDKTSIKPWGDIVEFMNSIREQDYAVLIISDAYLRSDACLYEVMQLMKDEHWDDRVMYVVTPDTHVYKPADQIDYIDYWEKECEELNDALSKHNAAATADLADELRKYNQIQLSVGEFMTKVKRSSNPAVDKAIEAVVNRVKGSVPSESSEFLVNNVKNQDEEIIETESNQMLNDRPDESIELREGWNFHNDIALRLEMKARRVYGATDRPYTKIYDADAIEGGSFAEVMIEVLRTKSESENSREDIDEFAKECAQYIGVSGYRMDSKAAQKLLNRFLELLECEQNN